MNIEKKVIKRTNDGMQAFLFNEKFLDIRNQVTIKQWRVLEDAMFTYAFTNTILQVPEDIKPYWDMLILPLLQVNRKQVENGKRGGAPKGSHNNPSGCKGKGVPSEQKKTNTPSVPIFYRDDEEFCRLRNKRWAEEG